MSLRVGLFYSASSRPALDSSGLIGLGSATAGSSDTANASYNAWQGYVLGFNHKSTGAANAANGSRFLQRVVNSASGLEQSLTSPTFYIGLSQPSSYGAGFSAAADTVYSATLSITRTSATELTLSYAVAGQAVNFSQTVTVGADDVIQFDAVNFYLKQGTTASTKMADSWNIGHVKIDLTITDQLGPGQPTTRTVTMIVADRQPGSIRTTANQVQARLFVDATPRILPNGNVNVFLGLEYNPRQELNAKPQQQIEMGTPTTGGSTLNQRITLILEPNKPLIISQAADPVTERKITVEVRAAVLK